ncbi:MAG TPA: alpha/beta hydrolase [Firmicutes bacterium]|nr:alpha/beta hydrolase [Bacillota bacterium]
MVYFPTSSLEGDPSDLGLIFEEVFLDTSDGERIHSWFIPSDENRGTILFCHGNGGNISHRLDTIRIFHELGFNFFIFDYRGYGKSTGKPGEAGTYLDSESAYAYLTGVLNIPPGDIVIMGRSLGGAVAARLGSKYPVRALILESTFTSVPDMGKELYPFLPVKLISRFKYPTIEYVKECKSPVLLIHSRMDEMISFRHFERLLGTVSCPVDVIEIFGSHNSGYIVSEEIYKEGLNNFFDKYK